MKCSDIKSSHLKAIVTIQTSQKIVNDYGIEEHKWIDKLSTRGMVKTSTYKKMEFLQAQGVNGLEAKDLVIRFCELSTSDRVLYNGKQFKIISLENLEEKDKYLLLTLECLRDG